MDSINPSFEMLPEQTESFNTNGFVKLKGLLSVEFTEFLSNSLAKEENRTGPMFSKLKYDVSNTSAAMFDLLRKEVFQAVLSRLSNRTLIYTQNMGFELSSNNDGLPWHVGFQSFAFQRGEDYALSVWIPLTKIDIEGQAGGMACVPQNIMSGEFAYQYLRVLPSFLEATKNREISGDEFQSEINALLNSKPLVDYFENYKIEEDFDIGDVLVFNKYVLHRSVRFNKGPLPSRKAYVMRFIEINSRYDLERVKALKVNKSSSFMADVAKEDGELLSSSSLLQPLEERLVKG